jgi:periplasmic divalent cation tolerance protein
MEESQKVVVLITTDSHESAYSLAKQLVASRKAACVNIVPRVDSVFWWEGNTESEQETLLIVKSKLSALPALIDLVRQLHTYDVPEIIALPIIGGYDPYLNWVDSEVE